MLYAISLLPFLFSMCLSTLFLRYAIPILRKQKLGQYILTIGPSWHKSKEGTPTLGGLSFLLSLPIALLLSLAAARHTLSFSVLLVLLFALANGMIGLIDDIAKLKKRKNQGLLPWQKMFLQFLFAFGFLFLFDRNAYDVSLLSLPYFLSPVSLGFFAFPLLSFFLVGVVNCANLTDGIDGLAASVAFVIGMFFLVEGVAQENAEVVFLGAALAGCTLGFLFFNWHPARIFMGDTGSLFLGAIIAAGSFLLKMPLLMLVYSLVFILEGVSVVLQVLHFKRTGKRLFKMAPFHHHLEKSGWTEKQVVFIFSLLTLLSVFLAHLILLKG